MELQKLRRNGVRTLEEAELAELDPGQRDHFREDKWGRMRGLSTSGGMLNVNRMDGADLLTPEEKRLCGVEKWEVEWWIVDAYGTSSLSGNQDKYRSRMLQVWFGMMSEL